MRDYRTVVTTAADPATAPAGVLFCPAEQLTATINEQAGDGFRVVNVQQVDGTGDGIADGFAVLLERDPQRDAAVVALGAIGTAAATAAALALALATRS